MKAVMPAVAPDILELRKRTGADRWDEMWEGVLHMPPMPNRSHQDLEGGLEAFLRRHLKSSKIKVYHQINLTSPRGWPNNYRIPDLLLVGPARAGIDFDEYFEGAPDVVVEIKSPGDETEGKMPFYASLGVPEVWVIHRDTKEPAVFLLKGGLYEPQSPGAGGWAANPFAGIEMRATPAGKLVLRIAGDASTVEEVPED
jgi:Uma2 family endonuclease